MSEGIFIVPEHIKITMRKFYEKIKESTSSAALLPAIIIALMLIFFSETAKAAATKAIYNCLNVVIPCIFPMLTVSFFILEVGFPVKVKHLTHKLMKNLFGLSGNCTEAVILGLTGGYNTAVKAALKLKEDGSVSYEQAKRIALFFTNAGISFTVMLAGLTLSGSAVFGIRIYAVSILSNIISAYIYNKYNKHTADCIISEKHNKAAAVFTNAVASSSSAIISISFSIILFAVITGILNRLLPVQGINTLITITSEVTSAVVFSSRNLPTYITAGIISFGGICIFIQLLPDLIKLDISPFSYLSTRIINSAIAFTVEYIVSRCFPVSEYTGALHYGAKISSGSIYGTVALIFLCAVYLISVKNIKLTSQYDK